jgi:flagellar hook assembly protein FlgD
VLALARPAPNPGLGTTLLRFSLPQAGHARLEILDLSGRRLWQVESELGAGPHEWRWDGRGEQGGSVGAGLYFVRLVTPWGNRTERLVWLR